MHMLTGNDATTITITTAGCLPDDVFSRLRASAGGRGGGLRCPSLLRHRVSRCSPLAQVVPFWTGPALRGYMEAIVKRGQTRSAKSQCPRFEGNPPDEMAKCVGSANYAGLAQPPTRVKARY